MKNIKLLIRITLFFMILIFLNNCKHWEYNIQKNGIYFKKISQSGAGNYMGYMPDNLNIQEFPCEKGWIHFNKNWELLSFQLSQDFMYKGTLLPAHTWIHFPFQEGRTGYICSFPHDYQVQGYLCGGSGGYKGTHTGFYESGKLRSFFAPENVMVDGVYCDASLLVNVNLYENGKIKKCKLAGD